MTSYIFTGARETYQQEKINMNRASHLVWTTRVAEAYQLRGRV
jgi:hypothetical protein